MTDPRARRVAALGIAGTAAALISTSPLGAQVGEGLKRQAEAAVVQKGGQVIRKAIDCAVGEPQCDPPDPTPDPTPPPAPAAPTPAAAAPAVQAFTATVTPWITRDAQGWDHLTQRATFTGDAVTGEAGRAEHHILLCDPMQKWKGTLQFFFAGDAGVVPGDYPIVKRVQAGTTVMAGFFMPLATTFQEGTVTIDAAGPDVVTGTVRATYAPSKYLRLESGSPPETHEVEAAFQARIVSEITKETAPGCYWE